MVQNYCELKKNKIYEEIYDELLDEELNMNNNEHNDKIKRYLEKKLNSSDFIKISNEFTNSEDLMEDLILKITSNSSNKNLQGNTLMMYADENSMYELFYMEDLTQSIPSNELNEFGSLSNIFLQPVCWTCGIFKSSYDNSDTKIYPDIISKSDVGKLFIHNFYHVGLMLNTDNTMVEIEFTGQDPYKMIGNNYTQSNTFDLLGFNFVPWIEKSDDKSSVQLNTNATKLLGSETYGRVFIALVCPNTNKKFWNITIKTMNKILSIIADDDRYNKISKELEVKELNLNPFYLLKKHSI